MNRAMRPIGLADEPDFVLGGANVRPSLRTFAANGAEETVEPRVMLALVALARRAGEVVGRDELVALCWEGRVIGDDAIQRAVAKVRKLGQASGAFRVDTVAKVGYRLRARSDEAETVSSMISAANAEPTLKANSPFGDLVPKHSSRPSIAILPFVNRSGLPEDDVFVDGLVDDLTAALSSSPWTMVVAASATAAHRRGPRNLQQLGRDVGARYLLEGNLRRAGEAIRVTVQLIDAAGGAILWTQKFGRPAGGSPALQEDLAADMAAGLGAQIQRVEIERAIRRPEDSTTWAALMRAAAHTTHGTRSGAEAAVAESRRAVSHNPHDGAAYAMLAAYQSLLLHHRGGDDPDLASEIGDNISKARALDPNNPVVLEGLAIALAGLKRPEDALPFAERSVAITPNSDRARIVRGIVLTRMGRPEEAMAELDEAERLAPGGLWLNILWQFRSVAHLQAGRPEAALEAAQRSLRLALGSAPLIQSMLCLAKLNDWERARGALLRLCEIEPGLSRDLMEKLVRDLHYASGQVGDYVVLARKVWDGAGASPSNPLDAR
jgi:TolB-like protein